MKTNRRPISEADIIRVNEVTDLVELVNQYTRVRRTGISYTALCPFHRETTPSFSINPRENLWLCRGCQAAGNPVQFVMKIERIPFPAAVRLLAARAGVTLADSRADTANQQAYDKMVAAEAVWYWERVRAAYNEREGIRWRMAHLALDAREDGDSWELLCAQVRWKRSAERWGRILARLDATDRADLVVRYARIRVLHPEIVKAYRLERDSRAAFWREIKIGCVKISPEKFVEMFDAMISRVAELNYPDAEKVAARWKETHGPRLW